jgi:membrane protein DedA with SNARE-associated domain
LEQLTHGIETIVLWWVGSLEQSGYWGIFLLMTIESSFIPFPSEIVMLPAGVLAHHGKLNLWLAILSGTAGSLAGGLINYYFARLVGRTFLDRYGKYLLISPEQLHRAERMWDQHGELTTFVCRLLPAIRQLISLPAGLARMNLFRFCLWTSLGAGLWVTILTLTGYFLGEQATSLWEQRKTEVTLGVLLLAAVLGATMFLVKRMRKQRSPQAIVERDLPPESKRPD